jgi:site-specific DNA-methyltransferase (adenine-specific)
MVVASTRPGDICLDFFAGSGTLGAVAAKNGRDYVLIDESPEAVAVATRRLAAIDLAIHPEERETTERAHP